MALELRRGEGLTYADLADAPDDGHRYELIDGTLVVTPSPNVRHQVALGRLHVLLATAAPPGMEVLMAPLDVKVSEMTAVQPDLLVLNRPDLSAASVTSPPLLVIEVLSPSTRKIDIATKRLVYESFGVPSYWIVDPDAPSISVLELGPDGKYVEVAAGQTMSESVTIDRPFPVTVVPGSLVA